MLTGFLADQARVLAEVAADCAPLVDDLADILDGGKRLRPAFCYWGWRVCGGPEVTGPDPAVVAAAASLELFQAAALVHDDVMDDSDLRRGKPAVHRRFAGRHAERGWAGDTARFGLAGAILAGDLCLVWSDQLFSASGLPAEALARARGPFDRMRTQLMAGQYLDMLEQAGGMSDSPAARGPLERARRVVQFKSAKYTIEEPLLIGAALADADARRTAALTAFGLPLGEAFQLRDDVLGVFGDPAQTGKPAGDDLREGKRTVLIARALETATPAQAALIAERLGDPGLDPAGVAALREVLIDTGAVDAVEVMIEERVRAARAALAAFDAPPGTQEALTVLDALIDAATARES